MNQKSIGYVFEYDNVNIIGSDDEEFYEKLAEIIEKAGDIIIHRPSLETIKLTNESLYNLIDDYSLVKQADEYNEKLRKLRKENFEVNTKQNYKLIDEFIDLYKNNTKPYIVASAGPSIDGQLNLLKENREKFNVISVGTSLRTLMAKGIKPNAIVITDGHEILKNQLEGHANEDIPLSLFKGVKVGSELL
ncbi:6-hydroxymethylpterin diphosphokinase MptE-like protein [Clostridium sp.]|uniref:6-hydroxymethylpterin diphosphokinase MptE-like protein n=1 Tax=Clostridium sp. TaxID=1506 RepID=UPI0026285DE9|nr:6-hydroxymethylpterin diphosphokinase MptE-like protein [Clostridium sp.]